MNGKAGGSSSKAVQMVDDSDSEVAEAPSVVSTNKVEGAKRGEARGRTRTRNVHASGDLDASTSILSKGIIPGASPTRVAQLRAAAEAKIQRTKAAGAAPGLAGAPPGHSGAPGLSDGLAGALPGAVASGTAARGPSVTRKGAGGRTKKGPSANEQRAKELLRRSIHVANKRIPKCEFSKFFTNAFLMLNFTNALLIFSLAYANTIIN